LAPSQVGISRVQPSQFRANTRVPVQQLSLDKFRRPLPTFSAITVSACNLRPTSQRDGAATGTETRSEPMMRQIPGNGRRTSRSRGPTPIRSRGSLASDVSNSLLHVFTRRILPGTAVGTRVLSVTWLQAADYIGTTFILSGTARMGLAGDPRRGRRDLRVHGYRPPPSVFSVFFFCWFLFFFLCFYVVGHVGRPSRRAIPNTPTA